MITKEVALNPFGAEIGDTAQVEDFLFDLLGDFAFGEFVGLSAAREKAIDPFGLVAADPFAECGSGDAAAPTGQGSMSGFLIHGDPSEALLEHVGRIHRWGRLSIQTT